MRARAGQAALATGRLLHRLVQLAFLLLLLIACGLGALAWRLSRGPLDLPWLLPRLQAAGEAQGVHLSIAGVALAWEGFRQGVDRPLDLQLTDLTVSNAAGNSVIHVPRAGLSLSLGRLLAGQFVPRALTMSGAHLSVLREADGTMTLNLGGLASSVSQAEGSSEAVVAELGRRPQTDRDTARSPWSQLRRVQIRDAVLTVTDRPLSLTWQATSLMIGLDRPAPGGVAVHATAMLALGGTQAALELDGQLRPESAEAAISGRLGAIRPASLAAASPALAGLAALDAPVMLAVSAELSNSFALIHARLQAGIGPGRLHLGNGSVELVGADMTAEGNASAGTLKIERLAVAPRPDGPASTFHGAVQARRENDAVLASAALDLDGASFADLPELWPPGVGGKGARPWITENITAGRATNGHVDLSLRLPTDLSDAKLTAISGGIDGHDLTVHWLRPVPPIVHGEARLSFENPDVMAIAVRSGLQLGGNIAIRGGAVRLSGLAGFDQFADVYSDFAGPLADVLALLRNPRIHLLEREPIPLRDPAGQVTGHFGVTSLPLRKDVSLDDLRVRNTAHLTGVHLGGIVAGHDLDQGVLDLQASNDGLTLNGSAQLAGIPAQLQAEMDFRAGPPTQVLQEVTVSGTANDRQLRALGLDAADAVTGSADLQAGLQMRRDGRGDASVQADLAQAALQIPRLWSKPVGKKAEAEVHVLLDHGSIAGIDRIRLNGDGIAAQASLDFAAGRPARLRLQHVMLGPDTDLHGEIAWPAAGLPWSVALAGTSLDASGLLKPKKQSPTTEQEPGPAWTADLQLSRVVLGPGRSVENVSLRAANDGAIMRQLNLAGRTSASAPFTLTITPAGQERRLGGSSADAGALLRAFDIIDDMQGGQMTLSGRYDDTAADHPLSGSVEIANFRMRNAPVLARLLQAMTLYGVVQMMQGPGLGFDRLEVPFRLAGDTLTLSDAKAFSSSLGMTAEGTLDVAQQLCNVQGTIVPAYFFNSLPGRVPLLGKLFSPESGGGVFAATYAVHGDCNDPTVHINPLSALTPGFLRKLFGLFDNPAGNAGPGTATGPGGSRQ